ncbi:DegT/DnrJ/EryC1/StrS family aminotransferase [Methanobrevibacter oralis]|uniref:dTDP-4-amino-4,6-dideoxy-D-glucose transaminase n=1 Tax=Methanobrevibacter oralis TaxID=66851 RepID=A0A166AAQ4_METOA|nr:DegT/DnrJ/EryC1/StrS family aminotransferase [Methanobrevibacter oralis]KZX11794.1 dTDP-4-amino-4,6-dideoxy-D-glucose transaminase [Methanobrevibacter oralis]
MENLKFKNPVFVTRPLLPSIDEYGKRIKEIWENKWLTNHGPLEQELQLKLKKFLGVKNIELFANGHISLELAIKTLNLTGEIITTPFTFASTTQSIINNGLTPVYADIDEEYYNLNPDNIEELITDKTTAIMPVHVFGNPCEVEKIDKIAKKYDLNVIYDAAHAFNVSINEIPIGNYGDLSMFSFHATKVFNTVEGGALVFENDDFNYRLKSIKNFGITPDTEEVQFLGQNGKMNEFEAAMGIVNLENVENAISKRKQLYEKYLESLSYLENNSKVKVIRPKDNVDYNYAYFTIKLNSNKERDYIFDKLPEYNVYAKKYFYPPCNEFPAYDFKKNTPIAKNVSDTILSLPLYVGLELNDVEKICKIIEFELIEFNK